VELVLFYIFSSLAVISGLMVIRSENPVGSAVAAGVLLALVG
jgi:NADH:ubiquinone oxidoreductase subunit 6 (subunit J)